MNYNLTESPPCDICGGGSFDTISTQVQFKMPYRVVICETCGLVQINPRPEKEELNRFYETEYVKLYSTPRNLGTDSFKDRGYLFYSFSEKYLDKSSEMNILEIGSGGGGNLVAFMEKLNLNRAYAIEPGIANQESLKQLGIKSIGSFYDDTEYDLSKFDLIIMSHVLEHFMSPMHVLRKLFKETGSNVQMIVVVPTLKSFNRYIPLEKYWFRIAHLFYFTHETLHQALQLAGWQVVDSFGGNGETGVLVKKASSEETRINNFYKKTKQEYEEYKSKCSNYNYYLGRLKNKLSKIISKVGKYVQK